MLTDYVHLAIDFTRLGTFDLLPVWKAPCFLEASWIILCLLFTFPFLLCIFLSCGIGKTLATHDVATVVQRSVRQARADNC